MCECEPGLTADGARQFVQGARRRALDLERQRIEEVAHQTIGCDMSSGRGNDTDSNTIGAGPPTQDGRQRCQRSGEAGDAAGLHLGRTERCRPFREPIRSRRERRLDFEGR
jgi:hypothetical protein